MPSISARRLAAGLAAFAAACGPVAAIAAPASAATPDAGLTMILRNVTLPVGGTAVELEPSWWADEEIVLDKPRITYTLSGLTGVSLSEGEGVGECVNESPTTLTCDDPWELSTGPDGQGGWFTAVLKASATAVTGTSGTITATFEAEGITPITEKATVRVAGGVDLKAGPSVRLSRKPGASFDAPLVVRNAGRTVAEGAAVMFYNDYGFQPRSSYSNCFYRDGEVTACRFDQSFAPGASLRGVMPFKLGADTYAPGGAYGELEWVTSAELEDLQSLLRQDGRSLGRPGSGQVLKLSQVASASSLQADTNPDNNWSHWDVRATGKNGADLVALGSRLTGAVGDVVTAKIGVRNDGPATLDFGRAGDAVAHVEVKLPKGTELVSAPEGCSRDGAVYSCYGGWFLKVGTSETYEFKLRVTKVVPDAKGEVVVNAPCECSQFSNDADPANNTSAIVLNGTGGSGDSGGSGAGGGQGGGLPVTGPVAGAFGGAGLVLLVAGGAGVVIARRRRTRFVA